MRDRNFYINSIKMDLYRVVTAVGDLRKEPAKESAIEFLKHAIEEFDKFEKNEKDKEIRENLIVLNSHMDKLNDPLHRYRWAEHILTNRCRLYED